MEKLTFTPNVPVQVALKFPDGKETEGRYGNQMFYSLTDGRGMYLNMDVATKINLLEIKKGEPFMICKRWSGRKGDPQQWDVWRPEQNERIHAVPARSTDLTPVLQQSIDQIQAKKALEALGPDPPDPPDLRKASGSVSAPPLASSVVSQNTNGHSNGNTNGHAANRVNPALPIPPTKIPMDEAVAEAVQIVQRALQAAGEQWSDGARQDLVSTLIIQAGREGWLTMWRRP